MSFGQINASFYPEDISGFFASWWRAPLFFIGDHPISLLSLGTLVFILVLTFLIAKWTKRAVTCLPFFKKTLDLKLLHALGKVIYCGILVVGCYLALTIIGVDLTGIAVVVGALSVGVGFGLQTVFHHLVAGVIIFLDKKVCIGDQIQLDSGQVGTVLEITWTRTLIRTLDNAKVLIPNGTILSNQLTNWTLNGMALCQLRMPFTLERNVDRKRVRLLALERAESLPFTCAEPKPEVWLTQVSVEDIEFELVVWIDLKKRMEVTTSYTAAYLSTLTAAFEAEKILLKKMSRPSHVVSGKGL